MNNKTIENSPIFLFFLFVFFAPIDITVTEIFGYLALLTIILIKLVKKDIPSISYLGYCVIFFLLTTFISTVFATDPIVSLKWSKSLFKFGFIFLAYEIIKTDDNLYKLLIKPIGLATIALLILTIPIYLFDLTDMATYYNRVSFQSSPIRAASVIVIIPGIFLSLFISVKNIKERTFYFLMFLISLTLLVFTNTRSAMIGFSVASAFIIWKLRPKFLLAFPLVAILFFVSLPDHNKERFFNILEDKGNLERIKLWKAGLKMFQENPIVGVGSNNYKLEVEKYAKTPEGRDKPFAHAHNNIITVLAEGGIINLISWITLWAAFFIALLKGLKLKTLSEREKGFIIGSIAALIAVHTAGLFEYTLFGTALVTILVFTLIGASLSIIDRNRDLGE